MKYSEEQIVRNIIQIRNSKGATKKAIADKISMDEGNYGRIENQKIALSYNHLVRIARAFDMSILDIITYPDTYIKAGSSTEDSVEAILQIKLKQDKKDQVLRLVFGENDIEILNK